MQLSVLEVVAHHQLEHLEQLAIGDEPIVVNVVNLERDCTTTSDGAFASGEFEKSNTLEETEQKKGPSASKVNTRKKIN